VELREEHFELARRVVRMWRASGYEHVVVVRQKARARRCYPCRQSDVPPLALASWDYYPLPTLDRLDERGPAEHSASRAELWVAATIAYGCDYGLAKRGA
jgi:hypothetical protein